MKILKWALIGWSICATLVIALALVASRSAPRSVSHVFCAYNRVFVEFEEDGKQWGTMFLDYSGRPIPCHTEDDVKIENTI